MNRAMFCASGVGLLCGLALFALGGPAWSLPALGIIAGSLLVMGASGSRWLGGKP